jgi:putative phosphoesterase
MRVGVVADTHCERPDASDLPAAVLEALAGSELILHCGDLMQVGVLDRLAAVAPVVAVRSRADPQASEHPRLLEPPHLLELEGVRIAMLSRPCDLPGGEDLGDDDHTDVPRLRERLPQLFGGPVDVVLYRGSHRDRVTQLDGTLFVDPGSPTFWAGRRATVASLTVADSVARLTVRDIRRRLPLKHRWQRTWGMVRMLPSELQDAVAKRLKAPSAR